jgi:hypothetical protein
LRRRQLGRDDALNSGRKVRISTAGRVLIRSTSRPNASRLLGSIQCASSKIIRTGFWPVNLASCAVRALVFLACAAWEPVRAWDNVHRSGATACRQRAPHPQSGSRSARAWRRACRALLVVRRRVCASLNFRQAQGERWSPFSFSTVQSDRHHPHEGSIEVLAGEKLARRQFGVNNSSVSIFAETISHRVTKSPARIDRAGQ